MKLALLAAVLASLALFPCEFVLAGGSGSPTATRNVFSKNNDCQTQGFGLQMLTPSGGQMSAPIFYASHSSNAAEEVNWLVVGVSAGVLAVFGLVWFIAQLITRARKGPWTTGLNTDDWLKKKGS
jgi:hypothetical protein